MDLIDIVAFINLPERKDRLFWCDNQLKNMPFKKIIRVDAVKSTEGHNGCALSHIKTLELLSSSPGDIFLVLEDDFIFTKPVQEINRYLEKLVHHPWDVFCFSFTHQQFGTDFHDGILQITKCHSTCAYMFHKSFIPHLLRVFKEGLQTKIPIDIAWQTLQKQYLFLGTRTPLVIQNASYSNIEKRVVLYQPIPFIKVHAIGELGNILFQVANAMSLCIRYHKILFIDYQHAKYAKYLNIPDCTFDARYCHNAKKMEYYSIPYKEITLDHDHSFQLTGYFQSYKFFQNISSSHLDSLFSNKIKCTSYKTPGTVLVSIHVRLGDYVGTDLYYNLSESNYYSRCIQWFRERFANYPLQFVVFSNDINACRQNPMLDGFLFDDKNHSDVESMLSMSTCDHHIIANSSFSWWGAHLNKKKDKIVLHPDRFYHSCKDEFGTQDYYPPEWIPMICSNFTMVICYIPLKKSKHSRALYEKEWIPNLMRLQTPMVIYTTKEMESYFLEQRRYKKNITQVILVSFEDFYTYRFKKEWEAMHDTDPEKHIHNVELYMIWNEKINLVQKTANKNPFGTEYFVYIDAGYLRKIEHEMYVNWPDEKLFGNTLDKDKVYVYDIHLNNKVYISGGFFAGTRNAFQKFHKLYYRTMEDILLSKKKDVFIGKDQNLYLHIVTQYPHLFTIQNKSTMASDPWFSPFWLHSTKPSKNSGRVEGSLWRHWTSLSLFLFMMIVVLLFLLLRFLSTAKTSPRR